MAIIFGGDVGITQGSFGSFATEISKRWDQLTNAFDNMISNSGPPLPPKENVYVDNGLSNVPGTSFPGSTVDSVDDVKKRRVTSQEPTLTVYLKKRAFSSLKDENNSNFMDPGEKLYLRATKILFEKKCSQIGAYESLTKASRLISEDADLDVAQIDYVISMLQGSMSAAEESFEDEFQQAIEDGDYAKANILADDFNASESMGRVVAGLIEARRRAHKLNHATTTNWVIDPDQTDIHDVGRGSGVIELTLINSINTSLDLDNRGSFNFSTQDPYNLMKITTDDIEIALSSAYTEIEQRATSTQTASDSPSLILEDAREKERELRDLRENKVAEAFGFDKSALGGSNAAEIVFQINPSSLSPYKVEAYTPAIPGNTFDRDSFRLAMLQLPVEQQLTPKEDRLVGQIFFLLDRYVTETNKLNQKMLDRNHDEKTQYARRVLRKHYLGKSIIQPMDSVHVFIRGKTIKDGEVVGPLSSVLNNSTFVQAGRGGQDVTDAILEEEMAQLGLKEAGIPIDFYKQIRTGSFMRNAGIHVFGGLVKQVSERYNASSGVYITDVSGESNTRWLSLSRVNVKPSLEQPQGLLEDPLTPFKIKTDIGTGLISEKPELLAENQRRISDKLLIDKSGVRKGAPIDEKTHEQDRIYVDGAMQSIWQHTPGMVYTWKPGVMVATLDANLKTSLQGSDDDIDVLRRYAGLNIVSSPFQSMDAADIISLLVTGYPHNVERFYENSKSIGTFSAPGSNASPSYFHSFFDITRSTNNAMGNFRPHRKIEQQGKKLSSKLKLYESFRQHNKRLEELRSTIAQAEDQKILINKTPLLSDASEASVQARDRALKGLDDIISNTKDQLDFEGAEIAEKAQQAKDQGFIKNTSDIVFKLDDMGSGIETDADSEAKRRAKLRDQTIRFRSQYDCKFNTDDNLLVIADEYDDDLDIQAYILSSIGQQQNLFNSEYKFPGEICDEVARTLDFEFFNDTQGNMIFRPPRYNKTPLSLLLKMFVLNADKDIKLYPPFLSEMFETRAQGVQRELDLIDLEIKEHALLLGKEDTAADLTRMVTDGADDSEIVPNQFIGIKDVKIAESSAASLAAELIKTRYTIRGETGIDVKIKDIDAAKKEIQKYNDPSNPQVNALRLQLSNKLIQLVSRKQKLMPIVKRLQEQRDDYKDKTVNGIDAKNIKSLLAPYQHLIEDDFNDFLGPGSAQRFIISDDQIISYDFTESDENAVCRVDVNGELDLLGDGPGNIGKLPALWAGATDFDMWRQYGYKSNGPINKPYFKDAKTQCAPYALFMLARTRQDIVRGRITVYGNEYYQLGDVVYINSRDMLYYVYGVKHDFSYDGGTFTTTLDLRYGHALGEYIPTPLDIIGKSLIRNQSTFNKILVSRETNNREDGVHLGVIKFKDEESSDEYKAMLSEPFAFFNIPELQRSLLLAKQYVSNDKKTFPKVEVRGWVEEEDDKEKVQARMDAVIAWLTDARDGKWVDSEQDYVTLEDRFGDNKLSKNEIRNTIDTEVEPTMLNGKELVDDDFKYSRVPSEEVYNADRDGSPFNSIEIVLLFEEK